MTDQTTDIEHNEPTAEVGEVHPPEPAPDTTDDAGVPNGTPEPDDSTAEPTPNAEAAKYRRRLREAEADRDRLAGLVTGHQRTEVERLASSGAGAAALADGADLWAAGVELGDLLDEDGGVDAAKVAAAAAKVLAQHPAWQSRIPDLGQGPRGMPPKGADLGEMLRRAAAG